jgi:dTDP-4-amino-4,6-dideoxygalactose transaminase
MILMISDKPVPILDLKAQYATIRADVQAAILHAKFKYLEGWTAGRQKNAGRYRRLFLEAGLASENPQKRSDMPVILPKETGWGRHIFHLYQTRVQHRNELMAYLKKHHVGSEIYYPVPLHLQACFKDFCFQVGSLPNAEHAAEETLALPIYPELSEEQIRFVVQAVKGYYE